jgi:predicted kinase
MNEPLKKFIEDNIADGFLLIACGLPGTGKSTALETVQKIRGGVILKSDVIRRDVLKGEDIFDTKVAGDIKKRTQVYDMMFQKADNLLNQEKNVYLDATFITQELRQRAAEIAAKHGAALIIMETVCPEAVCLGRILGRDKATSVSNAVTEEAYRDNQKRYETVNLGTLKKTFPNLKIQHITVDTGNKQRYTIKNEKR